MENKILLLLLPIAVIQIILVVINIVNLKKKTATKYFNKTIWLILLLMFSYISNIAYILVEGDNNDDSD